MNEEKGTKIGRGYVHVYTGNCKGKTTAALGLAFRAMGRGLKTYIGQFMKGQFYGELKAADMVQPWITIEQYGSETCIVSPETKAQEDIELARHGLEKASAAMSSGQYDIVVLDEIITANFFQLISLGAILEIIRSKPEGLELILTGRYSTKPIIDAADLVTEMKEVKHYYQKNVIAREGIER